MAPTPNLNNHRLTLEYAISGMNHKMQFWVNAIPSGGSFLLATHVGTPPLWDDAVTLFETLLFPVLAATSTGVGATLYERVEGAYVPIATTAFGGTPDAGHTVALATQSYLTFVDAQQEKSHIVFSEVGFTVPYKVGSGGPFPSTAMGNFIADVLDVSDGHIGDFLYSLAKNRLGVLKSCVGDTNEKLRRMRGLK